MKRKYEKVYQFKISLKGIKPPIWRRIQIPETYNFWNFHVAIQDAMGWFDCHLHHFEVINPRTQVPEEIGIPDEDGWGDIEIIPGRSRKISKYFTGSQKKAKYLYDYGDCWEHTVQLERIVDRISAFDYPIRKYLVFKGQAFFSSIIFKGQAFFSSIRKYLVFKGQAFFSSLSNDSTPVFGAK